MPQLNLKKYYPSLLKALQYKSTRDAAVHSLTRLGNDALPMLETLARDQYKPEFLRHQAWQVMGSIGTFQALESLVNNLTTTWGNTRRCILRTLLNVYLETGVKRSSVIDAVLDQRLGRQGIEALIDTEMAFVGQMLAAKIDLTNLGGTKTEVELLQEALDGLEHDAIERLFMLLKFVSPANAVQAAQVSLDGSTLSWARGIEILDNVLDITNKKSFLIVLDRRPEEEKLSRLADSTNLVTYRPMLPNERLRQLLDLRNFLSDWALACCFHLARIQHWNLTAEHTLAALQHPTGFVREAVLAYLNVASPKALQELLPMMSHDPDELVEKQVQQLIDRYSVPLNPA